MQKNNPILPLLLSGVLLLGTLVSCGGKKTPPDVSNETTEESNTNGGNSDLYTEADDTMQEYLVTVNWFGGRIDLRTQEVVVDADYAISDVIQLAEGESVRFDAPKPSDGVYTDGEVLVVSSWKRRTGQEAWVFDKSSPFADGESITFTDAPDGTRTYTYTAAEYAEYIRLCFRRGTDSDATPRLHVTGRQESPAIGAGMELSVTWNNGYVGSSSNSDGYADSICTQGTSYTYSDVIRLGQKGTRVTFTAALGNDGAVVSPNAYVVSAWKLQDGEWVLDTDGLNIPGPGSGNTSTVVSFMKNNLRNYCYVSAGDGECIRFCYRSGGKHQIEAPKITVTPTDEAATTKTLAEWIENDKTRVTYSIFAGKTINSIGDSYFAPIEIHPDSVWISLLAKKYGMTFTNCGISGSTVSNKDTNDHPMVDRIDSMPENDPDIVIFEGGRNDYNHSVPLGSEDPEDFDTATFRGAVRYMLRALKEKYPNAVIVGMNVWKTPSGKNAVGLTCDDYGKAFLEVCRQMNVPTVDLMDQELTGVYITDPIFRAAYCRAADDYSHLTDRGMRYVFPYLEKALAELLGAA